MANLDELKDKALTAVSIIIDKSTEIYSAAEGRAKYIAKTTKLKADIAKENAEIKKLYTDLGSLYYCLHKDNPDDGLTQICEEINVINDRIKIKQSELESMVSEAANQDIEINIEDDSANKPEDSEKTECVTDTSESSEKVDNDSTSDKQ